ncbi:hypothetical protein M422DRAFT_260308 [Sphaerobolus stellatus SS14]|uniref:Uncharacterized protein n=1 Tax=Sphaerobolus stellatus (strain SS14) TaxID=990650 RepID=A0A0C9V6D3_SPHS4|nr:hypothetical protein M422DRAFT_260308 [Sphaerobolus stellatus SS14]
MTAPEKAKLSLPSDFDRENHKRLGLITLADTELLLQQGQANDALKHLRESLGLKSFLVRHNHSVATGQIAKRRSETEIENADRRVQKWAEVYCRAFNAMRKLKPLGDDGNHGREQMRELVNNGLIMLSSWMEEHRRWREKGEVAEAETAKQGKGRRELPWIWKCTMRIEWLHAHASVARFEEEMRLLEAESERVGKMFRFHQKKMEAEEGQSEEQRLAVVAEEKYAAVELEKIKKGI